jgi:ComF family protein
MGVWLCADFVDRMPRSESPPCIGREDATITDAFCVRFCGMSSSRIDCIRSSFYFDGPVRDVLHRFKYDGLTALAAPLGELMADCWAARPWPVDVVVPVPLHASRQRERGYNQAALLAREIVRSLEARQASIALNERVLVRQRATPPQVGLDGAQRRENVRRAFRCTGDAVMDRQVLLIDDVCTTGATLEACAVALRERGARGVRALTFARARLAS